MAKAWSIRWTRPLLWRLYVEQGLSTLAIAKQFGCSSRTVTYQLERAGIERREKSAARWQGTCSQCGGERYIRARLPYCREHWREYAHQHLERTLRK